MSRPGHRPGRRRDTSGAWRARHAPLLKSGLTGKPQPDSTGRQGQLSAVSLTCAEGHTFKVQSRDGATVKCPRCWQERNWTTLVIVHRDGAS